MKYGQKVKITSGFYEGIEGIVVRKPIKSSMLYCGEPLDKNEYYTVRLGNNDDIHDVTLSEYQIGLTNEDINRKQLLEKIIDVEPSDYNEEQRRIVGKLLFKMY